MSAALDRASRRRCLACDATPGVKCTASGGEALPHAVRFEEGGYDHPVGSVPDMESIDLHAGLGCLMGCVRLPVGLERDDLISLASQLHLIAQLLEVRAGSMPLFEVGGTEKPVESVAKFCENCGHARKSHAFGVEDPVGFRCDECDCPGYEAGP